VKTPTKRRPKEDLKDGVNIAAYHVDDQFFFFYESSVLVPDIRLGHFKLEVIR
jgi:hypothetical protein